MPELGHFFAQAAALHADWPWWAVALKAFVVLCVGTIASTPQAVVGMLLAMAFDMATGIACARFKREQAINPDTMAFGGVRKGLQFCMVGGVFWAQRMFPQATIEFSGLQLSPGVAVALWFAAAECVSIVDNLDTLGVKMPPFIRTIVAGMKTVTGVEGHKKTE